MTLYLDEDLDPLITRLLRRRGLDAVTAHERMATGWLDGSSIWPPPRTGVSSPQIAMTSSARLRSDLPRPDRMREF